MHLLKAQPGVVADGSEAVDLGQTPGDIVVLSAADTELASLAAAHERVHGHAVESPARFVNVRAVHRQRMPDLEFAPSSGETGMAGSPVVAGGSERMVRFPDEPDRVETRIVARDSLVASDILRGPAIVEQDDTTTLIPPGWAALMGDGGVMTLAPESSAGAAVVG